ARTGRAVVGGSDAVVGSTVRGTRVVASAGVSAPGPPAGAVVLRLDRGLGRGRGCGSAEDSHASTVDRLAGPTAPGTPGRPGSSGKPPGSETVDAPSAGGPRRRPTGSRSRTARTAQEAGDARCHQAVCPPRV